jgi:hypothetical protein
MSWNVLIAEIGAHQEHVGRIADERDRREIVERIIGQLVIEVWIDSVPGRHNDESVAVRRRAGRGLGGDRAAGTGPVLDDDSWPQRLESSSPSVRPTISTAPPGGNGT